MLRQKYDIRGEAARIGKCVLLGIPLGAATGLALSAGYGLLSTAIYVFESNPRYADAVWTIRDVIDNAKDIIGTCAAIGPAWLYAAAKNKNSNCK